MHKQKTIFIHGTLLPLTEKLVRAFEYPRGLIPAHTLKNRFILSKIAYLLDQSDPINFPFEHIYMYGWSGKLCFDERLKAAQTLYKELITLEGPITIIAHSHGSNIALLLAKAAEIDNNKTFQIDRLILLACPVQALTSHYVSSSLFKHVYSLYSEGDLVQICDPQGLYKNVDYNQKEQKIPFFSSRVFKASKNLTQASILVDRKKPSHVSFILPFFIERLPSIITTLDKYSKETEKHFVINIPKKINQKLACKALKK